MPEEDKRNFVRIPGRFAVLCDIYTIPKTPSGGGAEGFSRNISAGGLLFYSARPFRPGETVRVRIDIPDWENRKPQFFKPAAEMDTEMFQAVGEIVRCSADGQGFEIAVKFIAVDDGHQLALDKLARYESRRLTEDR
ncbi:MAG: PilZ domain-containing protein [Elusimicrobiaceae bacterium]|nr:PilZ domain-containing protein [Elusimicrobiaceae bacterium]